MGELIVYQSLRLPSVGRPSTFSNILSSETTGPIKLKFHLETPYDAGTKVCSNGHGHIHLWLKPFKNLLIQNQKADDLETWYVALRVLGLPSLFK